MKETTLLKIIKSGNFTIYYHDNGCCSIYKGRHDFDKMDCDEVDVVVNSLHIFEGEPDGYYTTDVSLLVKALGGILYSV